MDRGQHGQSHSPPAQGPQADITEFYSMGPRGEGGACCTGRGIDVGGDSNVVRGNTLDSIGYIGIGFGGQKTLVENNVVDHACMTTHDCAGIYTWSGNVSSGNSFQSIGARGSEVRKNIVRNTIGNPQGCPGYRPAGQGIYLDDGSQEMYVHDNVVHENEIGLFLHNNRNGVITNNISFGNREAQIIVQRDAIVNDIVYGNRVDSNLFVGLNGQVLMTEARYVAQDSALAHYKDNIACADDPFLAICRRNGSLLWQTRFVDFAARTASSPELMRSATFESGSSGWYAWPAQVTLSVVSTNCRTPKCLQVSQVAGMGGNDGLATDGTGHAVSAGELYLLRFWVKNTKKSDLHVKIRQNHNPYQSVAADVVTATDTAWQLIEAPFRITQSDTNARVDSALWKATEPMYLMIFPGSALTRQALTSPCTQAS